MNNHLDILIFGAHPDDAEIGMGGTIAKHTAAGYRVGICDLTRAEMSSNGTVETRQAEANKASDILGLSVRTNLGLPDRRLELSSAHIERVTAEIRRFRPRIVFAPYWQDRHPDHVACSHIVQEAVFNAKLRKYMPDLEPVQVTQLYFYYINDVFAPDIMVDVTDYYPKKMAALEAYQSQFLPGYSTDSVPTPLNQDYLKRVEARDSILGQQRTVRYAEGFACKIPVLVNMFS